jgi:hypothetical protein
VTYIFHVTTIKATADIVKCGLLRPSMDLETGADRIWFTEERLLLLEIGLTSIRHNTPVSNLVVFSIRSDLASFQKDKWRGLWLANTVAYHNYEGCNTFLLTVWSNFHVNQ